MSDKAILALLVSLSRDQREAVYWWLEMEVDWSDVLPSASWERRFLPEPGSFARDDWVNEKLAE